MISRSRTARFLISRLHDRRRWILALAFQCCIANQISWEDKRKAVRDVFHRLSLKREICKEFRSCQTNQIPNSKIWINAIDFVVVTNYIDHSLLSCSCPVFEIKYLRIFGMSNFFSRK